MVDSLMWLGPRVDLRQPTAGETARLSDLEVRLNASGKFPPDK